MQVLQEERLLSLPTPQMVELGQAGATPGKYFLGIWLYLAYLGWKFSESVAPGLIAVGAVAGPPRLLRSTRVALGVER